MGISTISTGPFSITSYASLPEGMFIPHSHAGFVHIPSHPIANIHPWCFCSSNINGHFYLVIKWMAPQAFEHLHHLLHFTTIWGLVGQLSNVYLSFFTRVPVSMSAFPTFRSATHFENPKVEVSWNPATPVHHPNFSRIIPWSTRGLESTIRMERWTSTIRWGTKSPPGFLDQNPFEKPFENPSTGTWDLMLNKVESNSMMFNDVEWCQLVYCCYTLYIAIYIMSVSQQSLTCQVPAKSQPLTPSRSWRCSREPRTPSSGRCSMTGAGREWMGMGGMTMIQSRSLGSQSSHSQIT